MSESRIAFKKIREASRAAASEGHEEAVRRRGLFFSALGQVAMRRAAGKRVRLLETTGGGISNPLVAEELYQDLIAALPESCLDQPTFLGWAYQVWNEPVRDENSWAVSKRAESRHEGVDIAAVTQVFTDEYIADFLVSRCLDLCAASTSQTAVVLRICDPALGTGHILISAVRRLVMRGITANAIADQLFGYDIDALAVFVARAAVFCEIIRNGYTDEPAVLWEKLGRSLKSLSAPYGSLDRAGMLSEETKQFDVIVTNPPYLGRRKLPNAFRDFLDREYPATNVDLCAAFLQRCVELLADDGMLGVVSSDKWLRLQRYATVRGGGVGFKGLYRELAVAGIYELGERAFSTVATLHDGMRAALLIGRKASVPPGHHLSYVSLAEVPSGTKKQEALSAAVIEGPNSEYVSCVRQSELMTGGSVFLKVGGLPSQLSRMIRRVSNHADVVVGVQTNDDAKFVRYVWQVPADRDGWRVHSKGGGYGRWAGLNRWAINWQGGAPEFLPRDSSRERAESWAAQDGWVFSWLANGSLGLRRKEAGWTFGRAASGGVFTADQRVVAFMNSRLASAAARSLGGKIQLPEGTVKAIPAPMSFEQIDDTLVSSAVALKQMIAASDPTEALFCRHRMLGLGEGLLIEAVLLVVEGALEQQVEWCVGLSSAESSALVRRLGMVAGWYSPLVPLEAHPVIGRLPLQWRDIVLRCPAQSHYMRLLGRSRPTMEMIQPVSDLRKLDSMVADRWLLPPTGFVERVCRAFQLHPFDALLTAEDLICHSAGVRRRVYGDHLARGTLVEMLCRLGHRWWIDEDVREESCVEQLSHDDVYGIVEEQGYRSEYVVASEGLGVPLDDWVKSYLVEFSKAYFFGQSPLEFEQKRDRLGAVTRAVVE